MFQAAVGRFVKAVGGDGSLLPAPSLDAAEVCRTMHVVIKKNRRWCWQKPVYSPQPFTLQDLMVNPTEPLKVDVTSRSYVTYNQTSKFAVNGDVGASLKQVVDLKFSASDTINVEALFGEVVKYDVDEPSLLRSVDGRLLNFSHSLLQEVMLNPRKVLCIVVGTAINKADSKLHMHATIDGKEVFNLTKTMQNVAGADISSGISDDRDTSFKIPQNTPLAYNVYELLVYPGGQISVILQKDCRGGFLDFDSVDAAGRKLDSTNGLARNLDTVDGHISTTDQADGNGGLAHTFAGIFQLDVDQRSAFTESVLAVCKFSQDIIPLLSILKSGSEDHEGGTVPASDLAEFTENLASPSATWQHMLKIVGFQFKEDESMIYPEKQSELLSATCCLFEALNQLDEEELKSIVEFKYQTAKLVTQKIKMSLDNGSVEISDKETNEDNNTAVTFLKLLGFKETGCLFSPPGDKCKLYAIQCVLFALWLTVDDE